MARVHLIGRARDDERGVGIVVVLMIAFTVFALGAVWTTFGVHQVEASGQERLREQARNAAEAGVSWAMSQLAGNRDYTGTTAPLSLNNNTGQFEVKVEPNGFDQNSRYLIARGYAPSKTSPRRVARQLEQIVDLVPLDGFQYGLFSYPGSIATANNMTIVGDVYATQPLTLSNYAVVSGNIYGQSSVTTTNRSTISGDIRAIGNVTLDNSNTTVTGNVYSQGNVSITGTVKGNVVAGGTATGGTVTGNRTEYSMPDPPPTQTMPTFTWNPDNYTDEQVWTSASAFKTYWSANKSAFSGTHRIDTPSACTTPIDLDAKWTMAGSVTIVSDCPITVSRDIANNSGGPVNLALISLFESTTTPAIYGSNNLVMPADIRVLLFAPSGPVEFRNLKNFSGTVYAKSITVDQNFSLTFFPVEVAGFSWDMASANHFRIRAISFKEVPYTEPVP